VLRKKKISDVYGGQEDDALAARATECTGKSGNYFFRGGRKNHKFFRSHVSIETSKPANTF
jgi:hypothetical protein